MYRRLLHAGRRIGSVAIENDAWQHRSDALTSAAAFLGISIALWMGSGYEAADDWARQSEAALATGHRRIAAAAHHAALRCLGAAERSSAIAAALDAANGGEYPPELAGQGAADGGGIPPEGAPREPLGGDCGVDPGGGPEGPDDW